jgi:hypothetical protein
MLEISCEFEIEYETVRNWMRAYRKEEVTREYAGKV